MPPAVVASGLSKEFGKLKAVDDLSLSVQEGEILGFLGPNGAGKTTSIRLMTGLLQPTAGETTILGEKVTPGGGRAKDLVGVCPQEIVIWDNLSAIENLTFMGEMYGLSPHDAKARGENLLATLGLSDKAQARASELSGGMKRRLNVALALVHDPSVVVLDEPEAGLDPQARVVVREFIRSLRREKTVILTTHDMASVERVADRVAIMDHGKLIALDTPDALKARIGEGDVLEIKVGEGAGALADRLRAKVPGSTVTALEDTVVVRGLALAQRFADIVREVETAGMQVRDVRYRGNTLEDVFIALTGRGLRE